MNPSQSPSDTTVATWFSQLRVTDNTTDDDSDMGEDECDTEDQQDSCEGESGDDIESDDGSGDDESSDEESNDEDYSYWSVFGSFRRCT